MKARLFFLTNAGALQPPWRIAAFCFISLLSITASAVLAGPLASAFFARIGLRGVSVDSWIAAIGLLAATAICVRMIDKRPWSMVWMDSGAARPPALALGYVVGAVCIGLPTLVMIAGGWLGLEPGPPGSWWISMARITAVLLPAALLEELATRGYILAVLREWWGWKWAVGATSIAFGLLHLQNRGATFGSVALVILAGVFLAAVLIATRSLYAAWMAHYAWNFMMAAVFHAAVSGQPFETPGYRYVDAGPDWLTGGVWGPEGGIPAALAMMAGIAVLLRRRRYGPTSSTPAHSVIHETHTTTDEEIT